ncbi:uncharacterized protein [Dendrobates tinctorius]|uniref:uncharacterized protein n=1 Tax=Dendrobates tinctorius TaxID=92724 RepID=UPI003CC9DD49
MDRVLGPHEKYTTACQDDIVVFIPDWGNHLPIVQVVLDTLRNTGFTINPKKCAIGKEKVKYLGYVVGRGEIKPQMNKIEAIQKWPQPLSKKQVREFLEIVGYNQRYISRFTKIAVPLTDLLQGTRSLLIKWFSETDMAFQELKQALCKHPILIAPDFSKECVVQTDVSAWELCCLR